jgi:hypothetical protein
MFYTIRLIWFQEQKGQARALFRIFVDFLPTHLLESRKVVVAHGVQKQGDNVFLAFKKQFDDLAEDDFVGFWCIYVTSLAHEQFIKGDLYRERSRYRYGLFCGICCLSLTSRLWLRKY